MDKELIHKLYPKLFEAAQKHFGVGHSKVFVDAIPVRGTREIMHDFQSQCDQGDFNIESFISQNFNLPVSQESPQVQVKKKSVRDYINNMWALLERTDMGHHQAHSSLLELPHPYIVPGGRFREIYYWDSYFTMLGLADAGRLHVVQYMVDNFTYLIDLVGFIPNGNRSYYCTRSQPPFFALMVDLLAESEEARERTLIKYLPVLRKEYKFWMRGHESLSNEGEALDRVIRVSDGFLNRYWDDSSEPRPEGYMEDIELASNSSRDPASLYRDIRAAAESGWDFSQRWFSEDKKLVSIETTNVIPIDLNCLMYKLESMLAEANGAIGDETQQQAFLQKADIRKRLVRDMFFDETEGFFCDLNVQDLSHRPVLSLAGTMPLYLQLALPEQAAAVNQRLQDGFLRRGGWVNTLADTEQQWDAPNGWAPSQWMAYKGLCNYGYTAEAKEGAQRWIDNNILGFEEHGILFEKYNVESPGEIAIGGEYDVQHGFGWTNAVLLVLMNELGVS